MPIYFIVHDADRFHQEIRPALTAGWRQRSFAPCLPLCESLRPAAAAFQDRYQAGTGEPLLAQVLHGLAFDRDLWRLLVGEVLLYAAGDVPEMQTALESLQLLLGDDVRGWGDLPREKWPAIRQAHLGTRDLVFGGYYRPDHAGLNDVADVHGLADHLTAVDPSAWTIAPLLDLTDGDAEEAEEAREFARQCFADVGAPYGRPGAGGRI